MRVVAWIILLAFSGTIYTACASCSMIFNNGSALFNISGAHYVPLRSSRYPSYDATSCFLMKARYNCVGQIIARNSSLLYWDFMLPDSHGNPSCSLSQEVEKFGGVLQLAHRIRSWSHRSGFVRHTNVIILGSSYLRQVYESIVCRFRHLIVSGMVVDNGPVLSIANLKVKSQYNASESGTPVPMSLKGCHAQKAMNSFPLDFNLGPQVSPNCSDDTSMVEFPGGLRFFYAFRHFTYDSDLPQYFARFGLNIQDADVFVTNNNRWENKAVLRLMHPNISIINFESVLPFFKSRQTKDCGWWDGARNRGVTKPPDYHPCMPGVPDDEANVLMFMLANNLRTVVIN